MYQFVKNTKEGSLMDLCRFITEPIVAYQVSEVTHQYFIQKIAKAVKEKILEDSIE